MRFAPRVTRKRGANGILRLGLDDEHDTALVCERPTQANEAGVDESVRP